MALQPKILHQIKKDCKDRIIMMTFVSMFDFEPIVDFWSILTLSRLIFLFGVSFLEIHIKSLAL